MSHRLILSYDEINTMCLNTTLHLIMSFLNGEFTFSPSKHHKVLYFYLDFPTEATKQNFWLPQCFFNLISVLCADISKCPVRG